MVTCSPVLITREMHVVNVLRSLVSFPSGERGRNIVPGRSLRARGDWPGNATTAVLCVMFIIKVRVIILLPLLRGLLSLLFVMNALF